MKWMVALFIVLVLFIPIVVSPSVALADNRAGVDEAGSGLQSDEQGTDCILIEL